MSEIELTTGGRQYQIRKPLKRPMSLCAEITGLKAGVNENFRWARCVSLTSLFRPGCVVTTSFRPMYHISTAPELTCLVNTRVQEIRIINTAFRPARLMAPL